MTKQDERAQKAKRRSTLKSIKEKRNARIRQIQKRAQEEIREINILYAEDPERLRSKYAADEYARTEKARTRAQKKIDTAKKLFALENKIKPFSIGEEIFTSIVQGIGAALAIAATVLLIVKAVMYSPYSLRSYFVTSYACTGASLFILYIMSTLHHALTPISAKHVFGKLSHAFTFVTIASGYSAVLLTSIRSSGYNVIGWVLFGIVWFIAVVGIVLYSTLGFRIEKFITVLYIVLGWCGIVAVRQIYASLSGEALSMLLSAAIAYTVSIPFYLARKIKFMHSIGSLLMLAGAALLFFALIFQVKTF